MNIDNKEIEKIFEYRYKLFVDVNKHTPSRNWEEAVLERDLIQQMNAIDFVLKTFDLFGDWLDYCEVKRKEKKQEKNKNERIH